MPDLNEPHTSYITDSKLKKSTNIRYAIINHIIKSNLKDGDSVLELFGGVGITSGYILDAITPKHLRINDVSMECKEELFRKYSLVSNITISWDDALTFYKKSIMEEFDFIFVDAVFKLGLLPKFEYLLSQLKDLNCKVMFTESQIFKMFFVKLEDRPVERQKHFDKFISMFKTYNLHTEYIGWSNSSSYFVLGRDSSAIPKIEEWKIGDNSWEKYLNVYKKRKLL